MGIPEFQTREVGLKNQAHNLTKQYIIYDGAGRPTDIYTVHTDAGDNTPCTRVQYEYESPTSSNVTKMKESAATWDATWDI